MRLLVTGGSGFTGRHLVRAALDAGKEVCAVVRSVEAARTVEALGASAVPGDLDDPASLDAAFATPADALINIASLGFGHAPAIVAAAEDAGLRRAVFVSTTAVTTALPAASKRVRLAAEETVRQSALDWTILRPTMIYGAPGDRNLCRLLQLLKRTPVLPLPGGGRRLQQPVHVEDLAAALLAAVGTEHAISRTYVIAGPTAQPFRDLVLHAGNAVGRLPGWSASRCGRRSRCCACTNKWLRGPASRPNSSSGWPRTRPSPSRRPSVISATRRGRFSKASRPRPRP